MLALLAAGCTGAARGPGLEDLTRPRQRLVPAAAERLREAALAELGERDLAPAAATWENGRLRSETLRRVLRNPTPADVAELRRIADFEPARRLGMRSLSEIQLSYTIDVVALEPRASRVEIVADLVAIDRSQVLFLGLGAATVVPQRYPLRSRGVLERELLTGIAERLFHGEEMLYLLGELGRD